MKGDGHGWKGLKWMEKDESKLDQVHLATLHWSLVHLDPVHRKKTEKRWEMMRNDEKRW